MLALNFIDHIFLRVHTKWIINDFNQVYFWSTSCHENVCTFDKHFFLFAILFTEEDSYMFYVLTVSIETKAKLDTTFGFVDLTKEDRFLIKFFLFSQLFVLFLVFIVSVLALNTF